MDLPYTLDDIDTRVPADVGREVERLFRLGFPNRAYTFILPWFELIDRMFEGKYKSYQAMDTVYHDLEHTMQATLCWVRMMINRHRLRIEPRMGVREFQAGLVAIMMHDVGYLKHRNDNIGTGAKFTFVHERRSCEMAEEALREHGWPDEDILVVRHLISCTGPRAAIEAIPFASPLERILGVSITTADYLGQMSDPHYVEKLPVLFKEFEESDEFRGVPKKERLFQDVDELLRGTPYFWDKIVKAKLDETCLGLYRYLNEPYPNGPNPYVLKVEENVDQIRLRLAS